MTKKAIAVLLLLVAPALAVDGKSLLIGIGIGLGVYTYQGTRNHVVLPVAHAMQRAVHPGQYQKIRQSRKTVLPPRSDLICQVDSYEKGQPSSMTCLAKDGSLVYWYGMNYEGTRQP